MAAESAGDQWRSLRDDLDRSFAQGKNSMRAVFELSGVYARLDETQRDDVNDVLIEWVLSEDETLRYDALFLVNETRYTRPYQPFVRFKIALKRLPQTWGTL